MNLKQDRSGVAALETALLAPLLVTLLIGITDFSMALLSRAQIARALAGSAEYATLAGQGGVATTATIAANAKTLAGSVTNAFLGKPTVTSLLNNGAASGAKCCPGASWSCSTSAGFTCADGATPGIYLKVSVSYPFNPFWSADTWLLGLTLTDSVVAPLS
jgi:Flp pilus assembly protein TadG